MFPLPNFQFFTTVFLSHSHQSFFYLSFTIYLPIYILDTITPSFTTKKLVQYYLFSTFFNQALVFTILRRHWLFLLEIFKVKLAIGWPLRWTKLTNRNELFSLSFWYFSLCEVILLFSFPNFLMILTFVTLNWLRIGNTILVNLSFFWQVFTLLSWSSLRKILKKEKKRIRQNIIYSRILLCY